MLHHVKLPPNKGVTDAAGEKSLEGAIVENKAKNKVLLEKYSSVSVYRRTPQMDLIKHLVYFPKSEQVK